MENCKENQEFNANPLHLVVANTIIRSKSQNAFYYTKPTKVPTLDEISKISEGYIHSKKTCPETFSPSTKVKSQKEIKLPRIQLLNSRKGVNSPLWYPEDRETPQDYGANRFTPKPGDYMNSSKKIFPTVSLKFYQMPTTSSQRFAEINPKEDLKLVNYVVNSSNVFKTEWMKYKDLKNRKFYPEKHPEFTGISKENHIKRDKVVEYRESMLKVKAMMNQAWGVKVNDSHLDVFT